MFGSSDSTSSTSSDSAIGETTVGTVGCKIGSVRVLCGGGKRLASALDVRIGHSGAGRVGAVGADDSCEDTDCCCRSS